MCLRSHVVNYVSHTIQQARRLSEADRGVSPLLGTSKLLEELMSRAVKSLSETLRAPVSRSRRRLKSIVMRFGLFIPQGWRLDLVDIPVEGQWPVMRDLAAYADGSAWDSLWVFDHFHTVPVPTDEATHEAWSLMSAYAASTSRIKLGQMCTAMGYRNPVYLAKVAATADIISGGLVGTGIGGGWYEHEWKAYGYGFPSAGVRLGMLDEGVRIMRDAWRDGRVSLEDGKHYQVKGAIVAPKPLQDGGPPLWIAGGGEKVTLRIAAKYAQYTNFTSEPDGFAHKSQILADHCRSCRNRLWTRSCGRPTSTL